MFSYGDIVKPKFGSNGIEYYIVTDVADFSKKNDGSDMCYEVMRIFPIAKVTKVISFDEKQIELQAKGKTKDSKLIIDFVMKKRAEKGWTETPDFEAHIYHNESVAKNVIKYKKKATGEIILLNEEDTDVIRYDLLETVDDCLDAMSGLRDLYNVFGDEAYLQLSEIVQNRLKQLI